MFDFGWQELMLVAFILVLVVGPKDLPRALKTFTTYMGKIRGMANDFRSSLMEVADQEEFKEVKKAIADTKSGLIEQTKEPMADIRKNIEEVGNTAEIAEATSSIKDTASQIKAQSASVSTPAKLAKTKKPHLKNQVVKKVRPKLDLLKRFWQNLKNLHHLNCRLA
jgi:sec-independent protein translocase protein TatB